MFEERLGKVFEEKKLEDLQDKLDELDLPVIPYDITLNEMQILLAYHGNMLAYLFSNLELVNMEEKKAKTNLDNLYSELYNAVQKRNSELKSVMIKQTVLGSAAYIEAQKELTDVQSLQATLKAKISALQEQNVSLRKIASIKGIEIEHSLD